MRGRYRGSNGDVICLNPKKCSQVYVAGELKEEYCMGKWSSFSRMIPITLLKSWKSWVDLYSKDLLSVFGAKSISLTFPSKVIPMLWSVRLPCATLIL